MLGPALALVLSQAKPGPSPAYLRPLDRISLDVEKLRSLEGRTGLRFVDVVAPRLRAGGIRVVPLDRSVGWPELNVDGWVLDDRYSLSMRVTTVKLGGKPRTLQSFSVPWTWWRQTRGRKDAQRLLSKGLDAFVRDWGIAHSARGVRRGS